MTNRGFGCIQHQLTLAATCATETSRLSVIRGWRGWRASAISFNITRLKLPFRYLSTSAFLSTSRCLLVGAVCYVSRVLLTAHYLQTNITRHIPNFPPRRSPRLPSPRLSFAERAGEDTYKVQYRYPYRDIPNIVVSISSVARHGRTPVWTLRDTRVLLCINVVRTSALYTVPEYIPSPSRLAGESSV